MTARRAQRAHRAAVRAALALAAPTALLLPTSAAMAELIELRFDAAGRFEHASRIAPGKFVELCGKFGARDAVQWRFRSAATLDFNIHYHVGKDVVYPVKLKLAGEAADTLRPKAEQDYCWMWSNKGDVPVELTATLERAAR